MVVVKILLLQHNNYYKIIIIIITFIFAAQSDQGQIIPCLEMQRECVKNTLIRESLLVPNSLLISAPYNNNNNFLPFIKFKPVKLYNF